MKKPAELQRAQKEPVLGAKSLSDAASFVDSTEVQLGYVGEFAIRERVLAVQALELTKIGVERNRCQLLGDVRLDLAGVLEELDGLVGDDQEARLADQRSQQTTGQQGRMAAEREHRHPYFLGVAYEGLSSLCLLFVALVD